MGLLLEGCAQKRRFLWDLLVEFYCVLVKFTLDIISRHFFSKKRLVAHLLAENGKKMAKTVNIFQN